MLNRPDAFIKDYESINVESLGKPIHIIRDNLESLISQSCSDLSYDFEKWLKKQRVDTKLKYVSVHHFNSDDIQQGVSCIFKHQSGGCLHIKSEQTLLMMLADHFYNAKTQRSKEKISNSDIRLQETIGEKVANWLAPSTMWTPTPSATLVGTGIWVQLMITTKEAHGVIDIFLDQQLIDTLSAELELTPNESMYEDFCLSLTQTPIKLNIVLSKKTMPLSDLLSLRPNDILPIDLSSTAPAHVGEEYLFRGRVAERDSQLVLIISNDKEPQT